MDKLYSFVYKGILAEESLKKANAKTIVDIEDFDELKIKNLCLLICLTKNSFSNQLK